MAGKVSHGGGVSSNNHIETARDSVGYLTEGLKDTATEEAKRLVSQTWEQLFASLRGESSQTTAHKGELKAGQEIIFSKKSEKKQTEAAPAYNYFAETFRTVNNSERLTRRESAEMQMKIKEIVVELRRLVDSSTVLQAEFKQVTMTEAPKTPGQYHLNFFDWVLTVIRAARMKVEDSGAWLASMKGKKGKQNYWSMFKKHGTSFGLSGERTVATQSG